MRRLKLHIGTFAVAIGLLLTSVASATAQDSAEAVPQDAQQESVAPLSHLWPRFSWPRLETVTGTTVSSRPSGLTCSRLLERSVACFQEAGDIFYVYDDDADGHSGAVIWEYWSTPDNVSRAGICRTSGGEGTWARCDNNFYEDRGYVRFTAAVTEGWDVLNYHESWRYVTP